MRVSKIDCPHTIKIILKEGDNVFTIDHNTNHLTWTLDNSKVALDYEKEFTLEFNISKEDEEVYKTFDRFYSSVKLLRSYKPKEGEEYYYYNLYDPQNDIVTIVSDEADEEVANYVEMKKNKDSFKIEFHTKVPKEGYESDLCSSEHIPVKINFEDSKYTPFDFLFRDHFRKLLRVVDKKSEVTQTIEADSKSKILKPGKKTA